MQFSLVLRPLSPRSKPRCSVVMSLPVSESPCVVVHTAAPSQPADPPGPTFAEGTHQQHTHHTECLKIQHATIAKILVQAKS